MSSIQSVVFERKYWTTTMARKWLRYNNLKPIKNVDLSHPKQYRYRINHPEMYTHFISKKLPDHVMLIIGFYEKRKSYVPKHRK